MNNFKSAVEKVQELLAEYLVPDSGISDDEVINRILGVVDDQKFVKWQFSLPDKTELISRLSKNVADIEADEEGIMDSASWDNESGILITGDEAKSIIAELS